MKKLSIFFILSLCCFISFASNNEDLLKGDYLGQELPGLKPQVFAKNIISNKGSFEGGFTINKTGNFIVYRIFDHSQKDPLKLICFERIGDEWIKHEKLPFDSKYKEWDFNFDRSDDYFYFTTDRPTYIHDSLAIASNIWFTRKTKDGWDKAKPLPYPMNWINGFTGYPSFSNKGEIYFHGSQKSSKNQTDIYRAIKIDNTYKIECLGDNINTELNDLDPQISPDGNCLVFMSKKPSQFFKDGDMYICYKNKYNEWSKPQAMGGLLGFAGHPCFSADGKYFFFTGDNNGDIDIFWISTKAFETYRIKALAEDDTLIRKHPPKEKAKEFAPGFITTSANEALYAILDEGETIIFDRFPPDYADWNKPPIHICQKLEGKWQDPILTKHLGKFWYHNIPNPKENEQIIYAHWYLEDDGKLIDIDIWEANYINSEWTTNKLPYPVNTDKFDTWPSLAKNGNLYFFSKREGGYGDGDIYVATKENKTYEVTNLGEKINTQYLEHDPCISPNGDYMIFCSRKPGGLGHDDLYITFKNKKNQWSEPQNLGNIINSTSADNRPYISPDGKALYFTSRRNGSLDIFWISTQFVENFRP